ncbi:hypothetical protein, unknown function [Leishmania tarentolae]|uniref:Uncharacterized protein n=1 Tax=Leishmania tarentolae TaxID=5689 RepID=A0A640KPT1_LEITA|nr:hypothetical protein, unknown function [Leishmania tarentolae]
MTDLCTSTGFTPVPMPFVRYAPFTVVLLLLIVCSVAGQARTVATVLESSVEEGSAALRGNSRLQSEHAIGRGATRALSYVEKQVTREAFDNAVSSSRSESALPTASRTTSTTTDTTATMTADNSVAENSSTTKTTAASSSSPSTDFSGGVLAIAIVGGIFLGIIVGASAVYLLCVHSCSLLYCSGSSVDGQEKAQNSAGTQNIKSDDNGNANPLACPSVTSPKRGLPPVAGGPAHVNNFDNIPYAENGIVPWTGRPPVLRGPQPACVIPTITKKGKTIPREKRVLPGLGLSETPIIPISLPSPPAPPPKKGVTATFTRAKEFFRVKVLGGRKRTAEEEAAEGAAEDKPVIQWFYNLVYFTAVDKSPEISSLDQSRTERGGNDDGRETRSAEVAVPPVDAPSADCGEAAVKLPLPATTAAGMLEPPAPAGMLEPPAPAGVLEPPAPAGVLEPPAPAATSDAPSTATECANSKCSLPEGACGTQGYPSTQLEMARNSAEMMCDSLSSVDDALQFIFSRDSVRSEMMRSPAPDERVDSRAITGNGIPERNSHSSQQEMPPKMQPCQQQ